MSEKKMTLTLTCPECGSAIDVLPDTNANAAKCAICEHVVDVNFNADHVDSVLHDCPCCGRKDFYRQADFNRKIGVLIFIIAAILSIWTYGISFIIAYLFDLLLFKKLAQIAICYKCNTIFRRVKNIKDFHPFNHYMNDQIQLNNKDYQGVYQEH